MKASPSYKSVPDALNDEAIPIWRYTVKKYSDSIYESKDVAQQWEVAKRNFERLCKLKGVPPYVNVLEALANRLSNLAETL